ncbi:response regulator [Paenibacillus lemnae]|uniref:Response regulator n=1 Tax=Paenibacillus lemnae TaxID=1330551 RepID=A0A848M6Q0_PAELE|nr:response regulator [Paenibacillus lemnae]NMO96828.1 response regulator [Paenibacillus lemnae]
MKLFIVEDEPRLRNAMAHHIPWEDHGIEVVGLAANGLEALKMTERRMPDLLLLDIQMPEMDGLTLIRRLKEQQKQRTAFTKMIILSGHDNFAYAQEALKYGVSRYLLKPAGEEEILQAVLDARSCLREELERWRRTMELEKKWTEHMPSLQTQFMWDWVGGRLSERELLDRGQQLQLSFTEQDSFAAVVIGLDPLLEEECRFSRDDAELLQFTIGCLAKELLPAASVWVCKAPEDDLLLIMKAEEGQRGKDFMFHVQTAAVRLLSHTREILKVTASAGICGGPGQLDQMPRLYAEACQALQERVIYGPDIAIPYKEMRMRERSAWTGHHRLERLLETALETGNDSGVREAVDGIWMQMIEPASSAHQFQESFLYIISLLTRIVVKQGWSVCEVAEEEWAYFQNIHLLHTRDQARTWLERTALRIAEYSRNQRSNSSHQLVSQMQEMISKEIHQDLTLHTISDRLYVNSSYLSRLFKQEAGMSFSSYVTAQKMERAKAALQQGHKVYHAARITGYRDVSYFTKVFRKYWGVTPGGIKPL